MGGLGEGGGEGREEGGSGLIRRRGGVWKILA